MVRPKGRDIANQAAALVHPQGTSARIVHAPEGVHVKEAAARYERTRPLTCSFFGRADRIRPSDPLERFQRLPTSTVKDGSSLFRAGLTFTRTASVTDWIREITIVCGY